jgi:shikimate dehydrogenase
MTCRHYAVLGDPISHSKSPWIHARFAQDTSQALEYQAIRVAPEQLDGRLEELRSQGYGGVNLTVPLKEHAFALAQSKDWEISERALMAGAVNTLRFDESDNVVADNTDGLGLVRDIERLLGAPGALDDTTVLLIGAGGAGQGVIGPLREAGVRQLWLANRSLDKAQQVAHRWAQMDATSTQWLSAIPLAVLATSRAEAGVPTLGDIDIVINASSASLAGARLELHNSWFERVRLAYDMMYGPTPTPFMQQAQAGGAAQVADGLGMLVEQAAEAFALWRGCRPETASVLAQLRLQLAASTA